MERRSCIPGLMLGLAILCTPEARADVIAAWHFDEESGTTAAAARGSVDGTLADGAAFTPDGVSGGAVAISPDGNGFVDMGNNFGFEGNSTFSIVVWVRLGNGDTTPYIVAGRHQATNVSGYFAGVNNTNSGSGEVTGGAIFYQAYPNPVSGNIAINDGQWHQIVGVHDFAGNKAQLFVDGVLLDTESHKAFGLAPANFAVGGILNAAGNQMVRSFAGTVDEVSIWDEALTPEEIVHLRDNPGTLQLPEASGLAIY